MSAKKVCAYCRRCYGEDPRDFPQAPGCTEEPVTHGICPACLQRVLTGMGKEGKPAEGGQRARV